VVGPLRVLLERDQISSSLDVVILEGCGMPQNRNSQLSRP
jgi:hypothetical protein